MNNTAILSLRLGRNVVDDPIQVDRASMTVARRDGNPSSGQLSTGKENRQYLFDDTAFPIDVTVI